MPIWLPMVPDGTNSAASWPISPATRSSSARIVGSSRYTSSPTSASAMARRIAAVGRVTVSDRRSTAPSSAADGFSVSIAYTPSAPEHLGDEEGQLQRLPGVQPRVARRLVAAVEVLVTDLHRAAEALGDVLTGQLDVDAAGPGAQRPVHVEETEHLVDDPVEVPRLVTRRRLVRVAVHRVALPHDGVPGRGHLLDDRRQHVAHLAVAHPADQREPAGHAVRVEPLDQLGGLLRRGGRADLDADRVGDP